MDWEHIFNEAIDGTLNIKSLSDIKSTLTQVRQEWAICSLCEYIVRFSLTPSQINTMKEYFIECQKFYELNAKNREYQFGYPANMLSRSMAYDVFAEFERTGFLANNCGDTFEQGNYRMDSKKVEQSILKLFAEKFGLDKLGYWGYISSGGSESNCWAIDNGFHSLPDGVLYFCEAAHYSIKKKATRFSHKIIPQKSSTDESINCDKLLEMIDEQKKPAIIVLTWGTTQFGSCDEISEITRQLEIRGTKYYLHVDAALYGGIPNNQKDAPLILDIATIGIHSISVSLHKYIGVPFVKSVVLSIQKPKYEHISYIGMSDSTTSGSRDIMPFSMRQQVFDVLNLTNEDEYRKNILLFEELLSKNCISYVRSGKGNTFVINKPSDSLCQKYQLSTFCITDECGKKIDKAHIIIFPYQLESSIYELIGDLTKELGSVNNVERFE